MQAQVFQLIKDLTEQTAIVAVPRLFVQALGSLDVAYFFTQVLYWSDKGSRDDGFFWKSDQDWIDELGLSQYQIRKARTDLEALGLIETRVMRAHGSPTVHYRVLPEGITKWILQFSQDRTCENYKIQVAKTARSLTEITADSTPEITDTTEGFDEAQDPDPPEAREDPPPPASPPTGAGDPADNGKYHAVIEILADQGVESPALERLASCWWITPEYTQAWLDYIATWQGATEDVKRRSLIARLGERRRPPLVRARKGVT